ncbi:MAG: FtsH protease activity modulator HflK, partial [Fidelibacterota bacterium]
VKRIITFSAIILIIIVLGSSIYTIDANENGVVLRFGKYYTTTMPGLHFKLPYGIDKVYHVEVAYQFKEEFGFRTESPGVRTRYANKNFEDESWILTGDLNIAEVKWIIQYKIVDPVAYLFNVRDVTNTIRDVSEATVRLIVGDRSFHEALQSERKNIADLTKIHMQEILDKYQSGISVQLVQLQDVHPPQPVADSFNEVNRAKQEQETAVNEARQAYNKEIYRVQGEAQKMLNEAGGYAIERVNNAQGDVAMFAAVLEEYKKAPQITRDRLYLETMGKVLSKIPDKVIVDAKLESVLPLLNLDQGGQK